MLLFLSLLVPFFAAAEADLVDCPPREGKVLNLSVLKVVRELSRPREPASVYSYSRWDDGAQTAPLSVLLPAHSAAPSVASSSKTGIFAECEKGNFSDRELCQQLERSQRRQFRLLQLTPNTELSASFHPGEMHDLRDFMDLDRAEGLIYLRIRFGKP